MLELTTDAAAQTEAVAAQLAARLETGDVVTISGELGSGKTTFVRGACRALGVVAPVTSPTFTIGHRYHGRVDVSHLDLFRFDAVTPADWGDLEPYFDDAIVFVEWPERRESLLPRVSRSRSSTPGGPAPTPARGGGGGAARRHVMLVLAFDTATDVATSAVLRDGEVLGERTSRPSTVLEDLDALLRRIDAAPADVDTLVVGTGPGSFTSTRIGLAIVRGLALALEIPAAGVSTLDALAAARDGAFPIIDARRRGVRRRPRALEPDDLELEHGALCVGSGAIRYRATIERMGGHVPDDDDALHVPHARLHAALAREFGPAEEIQPIYVRAPDAKVMPR